MSSYNITIPGGSSKRLPVGGKYCEKDIVVTAEGGNNDDVYYQGYIDSQLPQDEAVLKVKKITSDTYAAETTYTAETFILLRILANSDETIEVTYGDLTKTVTGASDGTDTSAVSVFFGTFNGVSDEVSTPDEGLLKIKGNCRGFGVGSYQSGKSANHYCDCVEEIYSFGRARELVVSAFNSCTNLKTCILPDDLNRITDFDFYGCTSISNIKLPALLKQFNQYAFQGCTQLESLIIPGGVQTFGMGVFDGCTSLTTLIFPSTVPPTLSQASGFGSVPALSKIIVPSGCGDSYKNATNWTNYSDYIQEEL